MRTAPKMAALFTTYPVVDTRCDGEACAPNISYAFRQDQHLVLLYKVYAPGCGFDGLILLAVLQGAHP